MLTADRPHPQGHLLQHEVADVIAVIFVYALEMIKIENQQAKHRAQLVELAEVSFERFFEIAPLVHAGEQIGRSLLLGALCTAVHFEPFQFAPLHSRSDHPYREYKSCQAASQAVN